MKLAASRQNYHRRPAVKIVFKAVGFEGNNEKLLTEMSVYIDIAKVH